MDFTRGWVSMQQDKVLSMLGLAKRAGKLISGAPLCEKEIKSKRSFLIVIAKDISENGKKSITDCAKHYGVEYIEYSDKESLGKAVGASGERTVVSINDENFSKAVWNKYQECNR